LSRWAKRSHGIGSAHDITGRDRGLCGLQRTYRIGVTEHRNRLFEAGQIVGADEHDRWPAVAGDDDAFMFVLDTVDVASRTERARRSRTTAPTLTGRIESYLCQVAILMAL